MADPGDGDLQLRTAAMGKQSTNSFIYTDNKEPQVVQSDNVLLKAESQAIVLAAQVPPKGMISPLHLWRVRWELFIHFLILFQSIIVPFELAFLSEYLMVTHTSWYLVEVFMMVAFLADIVMVFRTGVLSHGKVDYDARRVAWNYLTTWFVIDVLAWLPCVIAVIMTPLESDPEESRSAAVARLGRSLKFARVVRILRVLQIARIARLHHLVRGLQLQVLHSQTVSRVVEHVGIAMAVFLLLHLVACLWGAVAPLEDYHLEQQGLGADAPIESRYLLALWWASCALSFGGHPAPYSDGERVLMVFVNLANVAAICGVVAWCAGSFASRDTEGKALMDKVRVASRFASDNGLPKSLTMEMRRAIQHAQHSKQSARDFKDMVEGDLSQDLCQRVYGWVHGNLLRRFPPFSNEAGKLFLGCTEVPDRFLSQLAYEAKITTFMAGDRVANAGDKAETMAFVLEGSLLLLSPSDDRQSHVLREKYWFGEPVLIFKHVRRNSNNFRWTSKSSTRSATIVALENCKLLEIGQDSFNFAVEQYHLLNSWLHPVVNHVESGKGTMGCSCCRQLDHWVITCPVSHKSPFERLHIARSEAKHVHSVMGHPPRPKWLPTTGPGNLSVPPEMWGMRLRQWAAFIVACCFTEKWAELEESTERKEAGHVNLYQVCENMVKPWTKGTGNSVALLMNNEKPLKAEVMISHAWGESVLETLTAVLGKASVSGITLDTAIWFCTFAQYQPGDQPGDCGPTVEQQLALDPFKRVIESRPRYGMLVVHTSTAELYSRLWCVFEVNEAKTSDVRPISAYSMGALKQLQDMGVDGNDLEAALRVDTSKALCWSESDKAMIHAKIRSGGGFTQLDQKILDFRRASVTAFRVMFKKFADWAGSGDQEKSTFEGLTKVVDQAGVFVGLHCLAPYIEATQDSELAVKMMARAKEIFELLTSNFSESALPPPCIDPAKMEHRVDACACDDEHVQACLLDLDKFPFPTGLLEMAAGGCMPALLAREAGVPARDGAASTPTLQRAFQQWTGGSAKMRRSDLIKLLSVLGLEHLEQDIDLHFSLADTNHDGMLDFLEFSNWVLDPAL